MIRKLVRLVVGMVAATALAIGVSATPALVAPTLVTQADAATYVSSKYTSPKKGERSKDVLALQQRLVKANVLAKKYTTSYFGPITKNAVKKFQKRVGIKASGKVTKKTWQKLVQKTGKIKTKKAKRAKKVAASSSVSGKYTAPKQGERSKDVLALQQRLVKANVLAKKYTTSYFGPITKNAVKKFQKRVGIKASGKVTKKTWQKLVQKTGKIKTKKAKKSSKKIDRRCKVRGDALCIDKTRDKVYYLKNGKIKKTMDARFGCAATKTREGRFSVLRKRKHLISNLYHTPMPYSMFFSGGQAVHYSADFKRNGYNGCSHGCVNIRDKKTLAWVFKRVEVGDPVIVYRS